MRTSLYKKVGIFMKKPHPLALTTLIALITLILFFLLSLLLEDISTELGYVFILLSLLLVHTSFILGFLITKSSTK
ncbi:FlaA1/EpsC-like NDP-sugar epimerase [Alkalicoccobacillus murimartini]|uniref:FlaA1/EpsC-like NDP-sugar epimerase n=2 Tax=Alkalicoccobacillus murimartini TaxID=171685 RepID=A0ABT9YEN3_9BACI|nr:FlaA1/EpsC-like NDP-sugar epimerase [Alkalicoccobacillus murimartini]